MNELLEHRSQEKLLEENRLLLEEVLVSRKASSITANLVIEQFVKIDEIQRVLEKKVANEKRLNKYFSALHETALGLLRRLDVNELLRSLVSRAAQLTEAPYGFVYLLDDQKAALECKVGVGAFAEEIGFILQKGEGLAGRVWETEQSVSVSSYDDWEGCSPKVKKNRFGAVIGLPLFSRACFLGVIGLAHSRDSHRVFGDEEQAVLGRLAELASIALDNVHLYAETREAREAAEIANLHKSEFLANMSHEIRTPMNAILGMSELARKLEMPPKLRNYIDVIRTSAHSLLGILNDILDFSKIEAGRIVLEEVDFQLRPVLEGLSDLFGERAARKDIELLLAIDPDVPNELRGDPLRLGQILINLTNNALKFTQAGEIVIQARCVEKDDTGVRLEFSVADTGIGISQEQLGKVFSTFHQADPSITRNYGGTGLGLSISKGLVEAMGGRIWADSTPGEGSTFRFQAPFGLAGEGSEKSLLLPPEISSARALVVDDNETARWIISEMLERFSFRVTQSCSGEEALTLLAQAESQGDPFRLVLMDWRMPGLDGLTTSQTIRSDEQLGETKIIIMTAYGREKQAEKAEAIGVDAFLFKPIKESLLFDTIMDVYGAPGPRATPRRSYELQDASRAERLGGRKVLLAEDNAINQQVAVGLLEGAGLLVEVAGNGEEAVRMAKQSTFDVVLMDLQMPVMDGLEATREIRRTPGLEDLPIIALTAHAISGQRQTCLNAGMNDFVSKPIETTELFSALQRWIEPSETRQVGPRETGLTEEPCPARQDLPGIDVENALRRLGGNRELLENLLIRFCRDYADAGQEVRAALESNDREAARALAHTLKGVAGNLGISEVFRLSSDLQAALDSGDEPSIRSIVPALEKAIEEVIELRPLLEKPSFHAARAAVPEDGPLPKATRGQLRELHLLLQGNDFGARDCVTAILKDLRQSPAFHELQRVADELDRFDFDGAHRVLLELCGNLGLDLDQGS